MSLVNYSDSDDDADHAIQHLCDSSQRSSRPSVQKRKRSERSAEDGTLQQPSKPPPPLPSTFTTLYASNVRTSTSDDPALHGGRHRQAPHAAGSWPTFVYLEWLPCDEDYKQLEELLFQITDAKDDEQSPTIASHILHSSLRSDLDVRLPLHISLSAALTLTTESKHVFEDKLTHAIRRTKLTPFKVWLSGLRWASNFDNSRTFLVLALHKPAGDELEGLLAICNHVAESLLLPELYTGGDLRVGEPTSKSARDLDSSVDDEKPPKDMFHISIAWCHPQSQHKFAEIKPLPDQLKYTSITFDKVFLKIGNHVSTLPL